MFASRSGLEKGTQAERRLILHGTGSFLVSTHLRRPLAAAIAQAFEKEAETAPSEYQRRAVPSAEGIEGTLQAIEDQTTSFDWRRLLIAVGVQLELDDESMSVSR